MMDDYIDEEEEIAMILLSSSLLALEEEEQRAPKKQRRRRRWWVRPCLRDRERTGQASCLLPRLRSYDEEYYRDFLRMPPRSFDTLLSLVGPHITKEETRFRRPISPDDRLALAVRFLAAGETLRSSSYNFLCGRTTACKIVSEVCAAIWDILSPIYVVCPKTADAWIRVAGEFEERWNLPHCLGAIDGKHVSIECPAKSCSQDRNYKNGFSKSLLAVSDAYYRFLYVEIGHHGSESDGGIFARSELQRRIVADQQGIPPDSDLGNIGTVPYFLVGDEAFPLKKYLMRPYPRKSLQPTRTEGQTDGTDQAPDEERPPAEREACNRRRIFNYRLSRGRRVVENAFGILAQKWRILRRPFRANTENTSRYVAACIALHNFLLKESQVSSTSYCPPGTGDTDDWEGNERGGSWRAEPNSTAALTSQSGTRGRPTSLAYAMRDKLSHYFITAGKVPWQDDMV
uniref:DDE Tnp4 domain-containing protein n=1 Tax=Ixodes ricinus TaxID=34613 RepID=A0A6B0VBY3_IXORI